MSAYVISEVEVRDAAGFEAYRWRPLSGARRRRQRDRRWATAGDHHRR
jgi:hypothetical protein